MSKNMKCAPSVNYEDDSCIPLDFLIKMAKAFNKHYPDDKIILNKTQETLHNKKYKKNLVQQFNQKFKNICDDQKCWLEQDFMDDLKYDKNAKDQINNIFLPDGPEGKFTWLNTVNINQVMDQHEAINPEFIFIGALPIDFYTMPLFYAPGNKLKFLQAIRDNNFDYFLKNNKTKIGIIFNLDSHDKPGSHWVCSYCDLSKNFVIFFDSFSTLPPKTVKKYMKDVSEYMSKKSNEQIIARHNKTRHQYKSSECGMYCLVVILRLLRGERFDDINKSKMDDTTINNLRTKFFF